MYQPSEVWLSTEYSGDRWLTDKYVMLNVTGEEALLVEQEDELGQEIPDGAYKLVVSKGIEPRKAVPEPDIELYFQLISEWAWFPARPTEWSVAEHPGKAQLWVSARRPTLLGEPTWSQIKRHYPDCTVEYSGIGHTFRFSRPCDLVPCFHEDGCRSGTIPFCYAAAIDIPDGQESVAQAIASVLNSTSNREESG